tara:strand:- start:889 stop:1491 length:603 start_codon:yes stop_codon:yes gene_type:complete
MKYIQDNFLITGFGRSGTNFLSNIMNSSPTWEVLHEPRGANDEISYKTNKPYPSQISTDFNTKEKYGEVNSYLRFWFHQVPVSKKGIILRNPKHIIKSVANRKTIQETTNLVNEINYFWNIFHEWKQTDPSIYIIYFEKMVTDLDYLESILRYFNILDANIDININKKINSNTFESYPSYNELPDQIKHEYNKFKWDRYA